MPLSTTERDALGAMVREIPFDKSAVVSAAAAKRALAVARQSEIESSDKKSALAARLQAESEGFDFSVVTDADVTPAWDDRPVEIVVIGDPAYVKYLFDERTKNLNVTLVGWRDKQTVRANQISIDQRGQRGALTAITKASALQVATYYRGRVRPGHAEVDGLVIAPHIDQLFELTAYPVPELLEAWLPKLGIGGRVFVGGMNMKACQTAVQSWVDAGVLEETGTAGNCWAGVKVAEAAVDEDQTDDSEEDSIPAVKAR